MSSFLSTGTEACQLALRLARAVTGAHDGRQVPLPLPRLVGRDPPRHRARARRTVDRRAGSGCAAPRDGARLGRRRRRCTRCRRARSPAVIMEPAAINAGCFEPPRRLPRARARVDRAPRRRADLRRSDHRLPAGAWRRASSVTASRPTSRCSARRSARACRSPRSRAARRCSTPIVSGAVSQRGTYNGNPLSVAAAVACLDYLSANAGRHLSAHGSAGSRSHRRARARRRASRGRARDREPRRALRAALRGRAHRSPTLADLARVDKDRTLDLTGALRRARRGVPLPRGMMYLSAAHSDADIAATLVALTGAIEASI